MGDAINKVKKMAVIKIVGFIVLVSAVNNSLVDAFGLSLRID